MCHSDPGSLLGSAIQCSVWDSELGFTPEALIGHLGLPYAFLQLNSPLPACDNPALYSVSLSPKHSHFMSAVMRWPACCSCHAATVRSAGLLVVMLTHGIQLSLIYAADTLGPLADIAQGATVLSNRVGLCQPLHCIVCRST